MKKTIFGIGFLVLAAWVLLQGNFGIPAFNFNIWPMLVVAMFVLYNLGMMNYEERYREYATMKVIGYTKREIKNLILTDCMFTIVPGWLIGIPVGFGFLRLFIKVVSFDSYEWRINLLPGHFIMLSLFVILCAVLINLVISRKANNIVMTEALKSVE